MRNFASRSLGLLAAAAVLSSCGGRSSALPASSVPVRTVQSTSTSSTQTFTETYDDGTDAGKWVASFSVPRQIQPAGGSQLGGGIPFGAYLQQSNFPSAVPQWGTASTHFQPGYNDQYKQDSVFVGDWAAAGVTRFDVDLNVIQHGSWPAYGRPVTMQVQQMDGTGFSVVYSATYTTPVMTSPPIGWTRYSFAIDARGGVVPPGWVFQRGDGTTATNAEWATFLSRVDEVSVGYYAPGTFYPSYGTWTLGIDNVGITRSTPSNALPCSGTAIEDDDSHIAYANGWHAIADANASAGHFRLNEGGNNQHTATLTFTTPQTQQGSATYYYATSTKGGSAEVIVDGRNVGPVDYGGSSGSNQSPVFGASKNYDYGVTSNGQHSIEIVPLHDGVYLDGFCIGNATPSGVPAAFPGTTSVMNVTSVPGAPAKNTITLPAGTQALSIVAESTLPAAMQVLLLAPSGAAIQAASASNGVAVLDVPVTQGGTYTIETLNSSGGPLQVWEVATPLLSTR